MAKSAGLVFCIFFPYRAPDGTILCPYLSFSPFLALILPLLSSAHPVEGFARIPHVDILSTDACRICLGFARSLVWPPILLQTLSCSCCHLYIPFLIKVDKCPPPLPRHFHPLFSLVNSHWTATENRLWKSLAEIFHNTARRTGWAGTEDDAGSGPFRSWLKLSLHRLRHKYFNRNSCLSGFNYSQLLCRRWLREALADWCMMTWCYCWPTRRLLLLHYIHLVASSRASILTYSAKSDLKFDENPSNKIPKFAYYAERKEGTFPHWQCIKWVTV